MSGNAYRFGRHTLDIAKRDLRSGRTPVVLPARVLDCLIYLISHRDRAIGRDELISAVFGRANVSDAQLGQLILRARRAVDDNGQDQHAIRTIPRFGFRWMAEVSPLDTESPVPRRMPDADAVAVPVQPATPSWPGPAPTSAHMPPAEDMRTPRGNQLRQAVWPAMIGLAVVAVLVLAGLFWFATHSADAPAMADVQLPMAILPTQVQAGAGNDWVRLGLMDFVASRIRQAGLPVVPNDTTLALLPDTSAGRQSHLRSVAGAGQIVESVAEHRQGHWQVRLSIQGDAGGLRASARDTDLMRAARTATDQLLLDLGHTPPRVEGDYTHDERLQRAEAAMLANQLDDARSLLTAAGDALHSTPMLRYQLLQIDLREGHHERVLADIETLLTSPGLAQNRLLHARLLNTRGLIRIRLDHYDEAERDYDAAIALLDPARDILEWGRAKNGRAVTHLARGNVDAAATDLAEARPPLASTGDVLAVARVDSNLGHVERLRDRPLQALAYFNKAARDFESLGAISELMSAQSMVIDMQLQLLQNDQAALTMQRMWAHRPQVRNPAQLATLDLTRARVLMRQGRLHQADALLNPAGSDTRPTAYQLHQYALYRVELAIHAGQFALATRLADAALRLDDELAQPIRDWLTLRREQAAAAGELPSLASTHTVPLETGDSVPLKLAIAIGLRRSGQMEAADAVYRTVLEDAEQSNVPIQLLEVIADYVPWLIEQGRLGEASTLAGRVAPWAQGDYDAALVQVIAHRAMAQPAQVDMAMEDVTRLAKERRVPFARLPP
jgi:DNA-binding winged helix-turn-helix (wHTH) protein/tetratricopeptide (TPR) repeat protein